ncbi:4-hydroxy-tetrahydrodipicolinate synthase [Paenibacillus flagellatus]|uniref:4-hydroxy-tetrahydrodipicolinate synthase n=1 Tax=Paenibacillus flagellatus TaxID=2211139 RepID=A0A2V5KJ80_9BACL|nr:4-hydroxy-tetrahydrodipicolinate synthase [Paenibacillus flagellatus]PYI50427.1 4-hydroxy-tetrahydrodipicolinate synthase [Paenibacillus flagellatus]
MDFGRVITAMVTPFDAELRVDWDQARKLIDYLIEEQQSDSLVVCGTTGESPTLTEDEKLAMFKLAVEQAKGRCRIIAGTGSYDTAHTIHLTKAAESAGVDGILLVAPYYNRPSQEGLYAHFKAAAESTSLPVMLYNIPSRTGITVSASTTLKLAQLPNVVATKEAHSDFDLISELTANAPEGFRVYSGDDILTLPMLSVGAYGIVSVASHVIGKEMQQLVRAYTSGNVAEAASWHAKLRPIFNGLFNCPHRVPNPVPVKYALGLHGMPVGGVRLPLVPATEEEGRFIEALFRR